jgi:threonine/homoserine/homoserine lactone efflux protein
MKNEAFQEFVFIHLSNPLWHYFFVAVFLKYIKNNIQKTYAKITSLENINKVYSSPLAIFMTS